MDYKVRETEPAYAQLARQLREAVEAGRYSDARGCPPRPNSPRNTA